MVTMGKHKEWRKIAKKRRRKRIRTAMAVEKETLEKEEEERRKLSPGYVDRLALEMAIQEEIEQAERKDHEEKQKKWEEEEERVRQETHIRQVLLQEMKEKEEKQRLEKEEMVKRKAEEEKEKQELVTSWISRYLAGEEERLPEEMYQPTESQPGREVCPFFDKVAACRFRDTCSRNHIRPGVSETLLFPGFYTHFSIQGAQGEYDTDMSLEYEDKDTYFHFLDFYRDIREEFESFGRVCRLLVCSNPELHLRGNVYLEYSRQREAMGAYLRMNGRFYGGRQISCHFINITDWKKAICGLYFKKACPKGNTCNFLHVFKDPGPPFYRPVQNGRSPNSSSRWRWSESPEPEERREDKNGNRKRRRRTRKRSESRGSERKGSERRKRDRSRSRSRERHRGGESSRHRGRVRRRSRSRSKSSRSIPRDRS